jgi:hypothetical protein
VCWGEVSGCGIVALGFRERCHAVAFDALDPSRFVVVPGGDIRSASWVEPTVLVASYATGVTRALRWVGDEVVSVAMHADLVWSEMSNAWHHSWRFESLGRDALAMVDDDESFFVADSRSTRADGLPSGDAERHQALLAGAELIACASFAEPLAMRAVAATLAGFADDRAKLLERLGVCHAASRPYIMLLDFVGDALAALEWISRERAEQGWHPAASLRHWWVRASPSPDLARIRRRSQQEADRYDAALLQHRPRYAAEAGCLLERLGLFLRRVALASHGRYCKRSARMWRHVLKEVEWSQTHARDRVSVDGKKRLAALRRKTRHALDGELADAVEEMAAVVDGTMDGMAPELPPCGGSCYEVLYSC